MKEIEIFMNSDAGGAILIAMIIFNIVGVVWLGIIFEHFILVPLAYIIIWSIVVTTHQNIGFGITGVVAVITLIAIIVKIIDEIKLDMWCKENTRKNNALLDAICKSDKQAVQKLIENGANINLVRDGKTPLDLAKDNEIIVFLKEHGAKTKSELEAEETAELKRQEQIERLSHNLISAIGNHDTEEVESLISQGADVNSVYPDIVPERGMESTPLTLAVHKNDIEMVKLLVEKGADIKQELQMGICLEQGIHYKENLGTYTALDAARMRKFVDIVNFLEHP